MVMHMTLHLPAISPGVTAEIARAGRIASQRGWLPATSGNLSRRIDARYIAITRSGADKGALIESDLRAIAIDDALPPGVSAEAPLHVARYRTDPGIGAVIHVHTVAATVLSRSAQRYVEVSGFEMQKALYGVDSHERTVRIPVVPNAQDTAALAEEVETALASEPGVPGYLLAGHGLYAWGATMADAQRHVEALEFLLQCALEERRITR